MDLDTLQNQVSLQFSSQSRTSTSDIVENIIVDEASDDDANSIDNDKTLPCLISTYDDDDDDDDDSNDNDVESISTACVPAKYSLFNISFDQVPNNASNQPLDNSNNMSALCFMAPPADIYCNMDKGKTMSNEVTNPVHVDKIKKHTMDNNFLSLDQGPNNVKEETTNNYRDVDGNLAHQLCYYPVELLGRYLYIPHPKTGVPTHVIIGKLINNCDYALKQHPGYQAFFEVKYTIDNKDGILSYDDIIIYLNDNTMSYDGQFLQSRKITSHGHPKRTDLQCSLLD